MKGLCRHSLVDFMLTEEKTTFKICKIKLLKYVAILILIFDGRQPFFPFLSNIRRTNSRVDENIYITNIVVRKKVNGRKGRWTDRVDHLIPH